MHQARAYAAAHDAQHRRWDVTRGQSLDRFIGAIMRDQIVCYGFLLASIFWAVLQPWTSFPVELVDESVSLLGRLDDLSLPVWLLLGWMVVLGTIVPFALLAASLRHIPASRAAITAMFEPVAATVFAYAWLGESLTAFQLVGALVVLAAILLAQTAR